MLGALVSLIKGVLVRLFRASVSLNYHAPVVSDDFLLPSLYGKRQVSLSTYTAVQADFVIRSELHEVLAMLDHDLFRAIIKGLHQVCLVSPIDETAFKFRDFGRSELCTFQAPFHLLVDL